MLARYRLKVGEAKSRLIDYGFRTAFRTVWPIWCRLPVPRRDGVCIAVWANDRVLVVRHSYKPGLSIPGGGMKANEQPRDAAVRELREEVAIVLDPAMLELIHVKRFKRNQSHFFEVHLPTTPAVQIDRREIIYGDFLSPADIMLSGCDRYFAAYLIQRHIPVHGVPVLRYVQSQNGPRSMPCNTSKSLP